MPRQPHFPLPLPKNWPRRVRSATSSPTQAMSEMPQITAFTFGGPLHRMEFFVGTGNSNRFQA